MISFTLPGGEGSFRGTISKDETRAALTRAGFLISPDVNRNDGLGTASIAVEFEIPTWS